MATVDIYLLAESASEWIHALSIPCRDIERLALRPLKWLRFATFTVCGAKGHLSTTQGGEIVDYKVFNDRCTSSVLTVRRSAFREDILQRDDVCVITGHARNNCDAAHIIPRSKGDQYIDFVARDRSGLYEREQVPASFFQGNFGINSTENGILLYKGLHWTFGLAEIVFLKTPNFAMLPADVPRVEQGPIPENRTTLQYVVEPMGLDHVLPRDVRADWHDERSPPPSILLDFMYGAAIVKHWKCNRLQDMLHQRFKVEFNKVLAESPEPSAPPSDEFEVEPDDPNDPDWDPSGGRQKTRKTFSSEASAGLLEAMDDVLFLSMLLNGTTPRLMVAEWERQNKEKEQHFQGHGREKVQEWLNLVSPIVECLFSE